jgi:hypothetical protein
MRLSLRLPGQDFFLGGIRDWPPLESDCLYAETEAFGFSPFGFLASLLPLCCPLAIASSLWQFIFAAGSRACHGRRSAAKGIAGYVSGQSCDPPVAGQDDSSRPRRLTGLRYRQLIRLMNACVSQFFLESRSMANGPVRLALWNEETRWLLSFRKARCLSLRSRARNHTRRPKR